MLRKLEWVFIVLLLINIVETAQPWSYVPSRWFAACRSILTKINLSYRQKDQVHSFRQR